MGTVDSKPFEDWVGSQSRLSEIFDEPMAVRLLETDYRRSKAVRYLVDALRVWMLHHGRVAARRGTSGTIWVGRQQVRGWICKEVCGWCAHPLVMDEDYDAEFCPACNRWVAPRCETPDCEFCRRRPDKPMAQGL